MRLLCIHRHSKAGRAHMEYIKGICHSWKVRSGDLTKHQEEVYKYRDKHTLYGAPAVCVLYVVLYGKGLSGV